MIYNFFSLYLRRNVIRSVGCPYCKVTSGDHCVTFSGKVRRHSHRARADRFIGLRHLRVYVVRVKRSGSGVSEGELLFAKIYPYDPEKLTFLSRIGKGTDPLGNEYWSNVNVEGWIYYREYRQYMRGK